MEYDFNFLVAYYNNNIIITYRLHGVGQVESSIISIILKVDEVDVGFVIVKSKRVLLITVNTIFDLCGVCCASQATKWLEDILIVD